MLKFNTILLLLTTYSYSIYAQKTVTEIRSDGPGNTYELINSKFGDGKKSVIEAPGINHKSCDNHSNYCNTENTSDHITEVYDEEKGNVFQFEIHLNEDKDRHKCNNTDRQRNEIKTHESSPESTLGHIDETVTYEWSMKIPEDFQLSGSFTHFHQLKSKGGITAEEKIPLITITGYKKDKGDVINIRYSKETEQETIARIKFSEFRGKWINFTETVTYKKGNGEYKLLIENKKEKKVLLDHKSKTLTFKKDAMFMRPKWGIYRKITDPASLKDEKVLFGYFKITEEKK